MAIKTVTISGYQLYSEFDRDKTVHAYTRYKDIALQWEKSSPYRSYSEFEIAYDFIENLEEFDEIAKSKARRAALAKLTKEERELLGLE